ncbi:MAG: hypothetical protein R3C14_42335 [Caldilineaceae bacterium]
MTTTTPTFSEQNVRTPSTTVATARCPIPATLRDFYWGDLAEDEAELVKNHLLHCRKCAKEFKELVAFMRGPLLPAT